MTKNNKKGFTIIEVVLVLAIAGLIFLMVFIALPALQRSQRNTRRRQDMARILSAFNEFQANNNGKMPDAAGVTKFMERYVGEVGSDQATDPDGSNYSLQAPKKVGTTDGSDGDDYYKSSETAAPTAMNHKIYYWQNAKCGDEGKIKAGHGDRDIAIFYYLEGGAIYCGDNQ